MGRGAAAYQLFLFPLFIHVGFSCQWLNLFSLPLVHLFLAPPLSTDNLDPGSSDSSSPQPGGQGGRPPHDTMTVYWGDGWLGEGGRRGLATSRRKPGKRGAQRFWPWRADWAGGWCSLHVLHGAASGAATDASACRPPRSCVAAARGHMPHCWGTAKGLSHGNVARPMWGCTASNWPRWSEYCLSRRWAWQHESKRLA